MTAQTERQRFDFMQQQSFNEMLREFATENESQVNNFKTKMMEFISVLDKNAEVLSAGKRFLQDPNRATLHWFAQETDKAIGILLEEAKKAKGKVEAPVDNKGQQADGQSSRNEAPKNDQDPSYPLTDAQLKAVQRIVDEMVSQAIADMKKIGPKQH